MALIAFWVCFKLIDLKLKFRKQRESYHEYDKIFEILNRHSTIFLTLFIIQKNQIQ
jgi:hypothetical protein